MVLVIHRIAVIFLDGEVPHLIFSSNSDFLYQPKLTCALLHLVTSGTVWNTWQKKATDYLMEWTPLKCLKREEDGEHLWASYLKKNDGYYHTVNYFCGQKGEMSVPCIIYT